MRRHSSETTQRLVSLTVALVNAESAGVPALRLANALGYQGIDASRREALARDIGKLRGIGIAIDNVARSGDEARWVLRPGDSRIAVRFTPEQRTQLARAALRAGLGMAAALTDAAVPDPDAERVTVAPVARPDALDEAIRAVSARCVLRCTYNGKRRTVDPTGVRRSSGGWVLTGFDRSRGAARSFYVARMTGVSLDDPGTAREFPDLAERGIDPLTWAVDPPLTARLAVPSQFRGDVERLLGPRLQPAAASDGTDVVAVPVTNRWVFLARVIELGERVTLVGPDELRADLARRLREALR